MRNSTTFFICANRIGRTTDLCGLTTERDFGSSVLNHRNVVYLEKSVVGRIRFPRANFADYLWIMAKFTRYLGWKEFLFQVILISTVFVFYVSDRTHRELGVFVTEYDIPFYLNYVIAALFVSYYALPKLLYHKKYLAFSLVVAVVLAVVIFLEEAVLEQIYFPTTRGAHFPGVFFNLVGALPTIGILTGFKFAWDAIVQRRRLEELETAVVESELQFLKSQINPHFLFNNLNNLYAHALEKSSKTPEIILELSGVLRYMLYECREEFVPLRKEVEQLENFINLSELQIEGRGEIVFDASLPTKAFEVAPLILTVFVENAIKHSASSMNDEIFIRVHLSCDEDGVMEFTCSNTYSEVSNTEELSKGIGLENVQKRLNLLYSKAHELNIHSDGSAYHVKLKLWLKELAS